MNTHGVRRFFKWLLLAVTMMQLAACGSDSHMLLIAPTITSANNAVFTIGTAGTFTVTAAGSPAPTVAMTGALPTGVTFDAATHVLSGTPEAGTSGVYPLVFTATNGIAPAASQNFTLTVPSTSTSVLVVTDGTAGLEANCFNNLSTVTSAAGYRATGNVGVPAGSLSAYRQVWDIRFDNTTPLSAADILSYSAYLAGGGTLFVIGENTGFITRDNSIAVLIEYMGGGLITIKSPANAQTVLAPFNAPTALSAVTFLAAAGTDTPGTGALFTEDVNHIGSGIFYDRNTLANALGGRLVVVFDINFLDPLATADLQTLVHNLVAIP